MRRHQRAAARLKLVPFAVVLSVVAALLTASGAVADAQSPPLWSPGPLPDQPSVPVTRVTAQFGSSHDSAAGLTGRTAEPAVQSAPAPVVWPGASAGEVRLTQGATTAVNGPPAALRATTSGPIAAPQLAVSAPVRVGTMPLWVEPADSLDEKLLPPTAAVRAARKADTTAATPQAVHAAIASHSVAQRAGISGMLVSLSRTDTSRAAERVSVALDYSGIRDAFGAGYGERLSLKSYPSCILTTPQKAACRVGTPVAVSANDLARHRLVAEVSLPATTAPNALPDVAGTVQSSFSAVPSSGVVVLGDTPDASGTSGSFKASPLSASSKWGSSGSTGAFTYSYPIAMPPALGGSAPSLDLSYNSQDADGRTSQTNNQGSWVGDGWTLWPGSVSREYRNCSEDGEAATDQEQCWAGDNAAITFNGSSHELVPTGTANTWRFADDDGSVVKELPGASNGLNGGTYWQVTDRAGNVYVFGADHLPADQGGTGSDASTNSAWGAPVYGNNAIEPCHAATLDASWCTQGWQWNLDFSIDTHKNITVYHYATEANYYGRGSTHTPVSYTRGGALTSVTYGQRTADYTAGRNPAAKVTFALAPEGRCDTTGGFVCSTATLSTSNASHWPDVPYDQNCGSASCSNYAPSFWINDRLVGITTQVWDTSLSTPGYRSVDTYDLNNQDFPDPADPSPGVDNSASPKAMWLAQIKHTGADTGAQGTSVAENPVKFAGTFYVNRVPGLIQPAVTQLKRRRMSQIVNESGASATVKYQNDTCSRSSPPAEDNDHTTCYPVRWTPRGYTDPILDWFNKYLVGEIDVADKSGTTSPSRITRYDYSNGVPAWHHSDDEITPAKYRTWNEWRGYSQVTTRSGAAGDPIMASTTWYLQGMDGDLNANGTHKSVTVTPARGDTLTDRDAWAGVAYQSGAYDHDGGSVVRRTVTVPWISPSPTATHARGDSLPPQNAYYTDTAASYAQTLISGTNWRTSGTFTSLDGTTGLVTSVDDRGEIGSSDQPVSGGTTPESCTRTTYATNSSASIANLPSEVVSVAGSCGQSADADHILSDVKTYYDGSTSLGPVPGAGDVTSVTALKDFDMSGTAEWTKATKSVYDTYGRVTSATDAMGRKTATAYLPANSIALPTSVEVTNDKGWKTTTTVDVGRGIPRSVFDPNNKVATQIHDGLGRLTQAWSPEHPKSANPSTPNVQYTYNVAQTGPSWVETQTLRDYSQTYVNDYQIYDSLLQPREDQTTTADDTAGSRLISTTFYDSLGRPVASDAPFVNDQSNPTSEFVLPTDALVPGQTATAYDGMGRVTTSTQKAYAVPQSTVTTAYPAGNEVDVTPPAGATPTAGLSDARGHTTEVRQFHGAAPTGLYDATHYAFDAVGRMTTLTDSSGNSWTTTYDQMGDVVQSTDPDTGTTVNAYDDNGELTETTDARHSPDGGITTSYDSLGRATDSYAIPAGGGAGVQLTHTDYDPAGALGQVASATSYDSAKRPWTTAIKGYTADYLPTGSTTTVPAGAVGNPAAINYATSTSYTPVGRHPDSIDLPAVGPMAAETISHSYDDNGLIVSVGGKDTYLAWMDYTHLGQPLRAHMGVTPNQIVETYNWEASTGRLLDSALDTQSGTTHANFTSYTYNPAGQITSVSDAQDGGGTANTDTQCFSYDYLQRLSAAWTDTGGTTTAPLPSIQGQGGCTHTAPSAANIGGPDPYWQAFGYDATGNRVSETDHSPTGDTTQDITTNEVYPPSGATSVHPHGVSTATVAVDTSGGGKQTFTYDDSGNTTEIKQDAGNKILASGATLASGKSMVSNSVRLTMQGDGNLVLYSLKSGQAIWSSNTAGHAGAVATMGTDGNLSVHTTTGTTLWSTGTSVANSFARVQDDGQLIVFGPGWASQWRTPTWTADRAADDLQFLYDDNGRLAKTTQPTADSGTATTTYNYDAGGNLLARTDGTGGSSTTTTLFLGADQLTLDSTGTPKADARYYSVPGAPTAVRTATVGTDGTTVALHYEAADQRGSDLTDITADTATVTRRAYTPFGEDRTAGGNPTTWPGDKGYVGGTPDATTGLTNLGAREYDPTLGRFLSVDPVLDGTDPQSLNGYAYADNTPIDASDPTGLTKCDINPELCHHSSSNQTQNDDANATYCQHHDCSGSGGGGGSGGNGGGSGSSSTGSGVTVTINTGGGPIHRTFVNARQMIDYFTKATHCQGNMTGDGKYTVCYTQAQWDANKKSDLKLLSALGDATIIAPMARCMFTHDEHECDVYGAAVSSGDAAGINIGTAEIEGLDSSVISFCMRGAGNSFSPSTKVLMADGSTKPISEIRPGDVVEAADPDTGKHQGPHKVTATHVHHDDDLTDVIVDTGHGHSATLHTTSKHPFWDDTLHRWIPAAQLATGHTLETATNGHTVIKKVRIVPGAADMDNLTVDELHTYYVLAGTTPILVHNSSGCGEIVNNFDSFNGARSDAIAQSGIGDDRVPFIQKLGPFKGRITGSQSPDGMRGWRIDYDPANPDKGFHVNWWVKNGPKRSDGWTQGANVIDGATYDQYLGILSHFPYQ